MHCVAWFMVHNMVRMWVRVSVGGVFFFQAEDGIRDLVRSRGLGDVYKRQGQPRTAAAANPLIVRFLSGAERMRER